MLIFQQNSANTFVVTVSEILNDTTTGTPSGWTMSLTSTTTLQVYSGITLVDSSEYSERYNLFNVTLTSKTFEDYNYSHVFLPQNGLYDYSIYYWTGSTANSVLAESGILKVEGDNQVTTNTYNKSNKYVSYKKQ